MSQTPRTDAEIAAAIDKTLPDFEHYMRMTGVLNQFARFLEVENAELIEALRKCVKVTKAWHDMGGSEDMWNIYYKNAPEMKPIREALAKYETPA